MITAGSMIIAFQIKSGELGTRLQIFLSVLYLLVLLLLKIFSEQTTFIRTQLKSFF